MGQYQANYTDVSTQFFDSKNAETAFEKASKTPYKPAGEKLTVLYDITDCDTSEEDVIVWQRKKRNQ